MRGKVSGRTRGPRGSSPRGRIGRREAGKWNSTRGGGARRGSNGGRGLQLRFRPAEGSIEHEMERRRCRARLRGLQREESRHGGERWPESAPARRAAARVTRVLCSLEEEGDGTKWIGLRIRTRPRGSRGSPTADAWCRRRQRGVTAWARVRFTGEHSNRV